MKRMMMAGWMVLAMVLALNAGAGVLILEDHFENGNVTNIDSGAAFWTKTVSGGTATETGGRLLLQDKPKTNANVSATLYSPLMSDCNFFATTLVYNAKFDLSMVNIASADKSKMDFRFFITDGVGQNLTQSSNYFAITQFGTGNFSVRSRVDGASTPTTLTNITGTTLAQELTVRLDATSYYLDMIYAGGVTNSYTGAHGLSQSAWRTTGSTLEMMAYSSTSTAASTNGTWTVGVSELKVTSIPEPSTIGLFILSSFSALGIRRMVKL